MWFHSLLGRRRPSPRRPSRARLSVELLEDRRVLSAPGSIAGTAFEDLTGNGISPDDPVLAGWSVSLYRDDGDGAFDAQTDTLVETQTTDQHGRYEFRQLAADNYYVRQELPPGWVGPAEEHVHDEIVRPEDVGPAAPEPNDTLATAVATGLSSATPGTFLASGAIGDNKKVDGPLDVDFYRIQVNAGDQVHIDVDASAFGSDLDSDLRVFDSAGVQVAANEDAVGDDLDAHIEFVAKASGTYYVGVAGFANVQYNPFVAGSGNPGLSFNTGPYTLEIEIGPREGAEPIAVTLAAGQRVEGVDLVASRLGSIEGQMYEDLDGDGVQDPGEPGLDGQLVVLNYQGVFFSFTTTRSIDRNGDGAIDPATEAGLYVFDDLRPGIYVTRGLISFGLGPVGVIQTSPSLGQAEMEIVGEVTDGPPTDPGIPGLIPDLTVDLENGLADWFVTAGVLHFGQATPNIGLGPMELRAGEDLGNGTQIVNQRIYHDPELTTFTDYPAGTFIFHPEHNHIHFNDYALFSIREALADGDGDGLPDVGDPVTAGQKTSFCLVDSAPYDLSLPNAAQEASGFGCGEVQRISVGWMDIYGPLTAGQQIDVSGLEPGQYWLEAVVDPTNDLIESNEANNVGRVLITIGLGAPSAPAGANAVGLRSGQDLRDADFGNFQLIDISGQVFDDRDADGQLDTNEKGARGQAVFIDLNGDGVLNNPEGDNVVSALAEEPWALVDKQGNFVLSGVGPGIHQVLLVPQDGWVQTTPNPAPIAARSGQDVSGVKFGVAPTSAVSAAGVDGYFAEIGEGVSHSPLTGVHRRASAFADYFAADLLRALSIDGDAASEPCSCGEGS